MQEKEIAVDEDLPFFFETVQLFQAEELLKQEYNIRLNYGFSFINNQTIDSLRKTTIPKRAVVGSPWYSILCNPYYSEMFAYVSPCAN